VVYKKHKIYRWIFQGKPVNLASRRDPLDNMFVIDLRYYMPLFTQWAKITDLNTTIHTEIK
jgi:hypothetical protein